MTDVLVAQLPSPPRKNVFREWAGGMGTALASERPSWGHDQKYYDVPFSSYLYICRCLEQEGVAFAYEDFQGRATLALDQFDAALRAAAPRVLLTQVNIPSLEHDIELIARARALLPGLRVVLVGAAGKWFRERLLRDGIADVVMEEAEEMLTSRTIAALLAGDGSAVQGASVWRDGAVVALPAQARMTSLDFVDFPAYHLLDFKRYESDYYFGRHQRYATVFTTKGCPYKCGYCPYPYGFGKRLVYRAPELVGADIARLKQEFGVEQVLFRDQVFTVNPKHAHAVCAELIRRDLGVMWLCETRYDVVDDAMLAAMREAGCQEIHYGLESADPELFAKVAKTDGPKSLDQFERALDMTRAHGMRAHVHMILGMPDESRDSVRNSIRWLRRVKPDSVQLAYYVPYPGTPMYEELKASGELGDIAAIDFESMASFIDPVLPTRHMSKDDVRWARHRLSVDWKYTLADRVVNKLKRTVGLKAA